jgi:hypothetical protein
MLTTGVSGHCGSRLAAAADGVIAMRWSDPKPDEKYFSSLTVPGNHLTAGVSTDGAASRQVRSFRAFCGLRDAESPMGEVHAVGRAPWQNFPVCGKCKQFAVTSRLTRVQVRGKAYEAARPGLLDEDTEWRVVEADRRMEPLATEEKRYDNSGSPASTTHTLSISRTVARTVVIEKTAGLLGGLDVNAGVVQANMQATLSAKYGITAQESITVAESLTVSVPAKSAVLVRIAWYRQLQAGRLEAVSHPGRGVPYTVLLRLTFDVETSTL